MELEQVELEVEGALGVRRAAGERRRGDLLAAPQQHQAQATFLVSKALVIPMPTNRGPARDARGRHNESHGRGLVLGVFLWLRHGDPGVAWLAEVAVNLGRQVLVCESSRLLIAGSASRSARSASRSSSKEPADMGALAPHHGQ